MATEQLVAGQVLADVHVVWVLAIQENGERALLHLAALAVEPVAWVAVPHIHDDVAAHQPQTPLLAAMHAEQVVNPEHAWH